MSFLDRKIEDYITPEATANDIGIVFECDELDKYDFPDDVNLPEGEYYSIIMGFREYKDRYGKQYIDVCYKVFDTKQKPRWENGKTDRIRYYYIRQRLLRGSDDERRFRYAMSCMVGDGNSSLTDATLIGITEYIKIYYDDDSKGAIVFRCESELLDVWFFDDVSDEYHKDLEIVSEDVV